ncbi:MAG TPA: YusG family protein [Bacillus sp. (in: firmicutes)]|uniref:YusG family protein n=1 Tax=Bacillus litorisediminis TaxID=2922713 RepID=UPI001FABE946|nr:YusG family protein [Bacillus litorisediminis]HWO77138.1 YusG family protein [Bacillus sp. (in: firmicutes)]
MSLQSAKRDITDQVIGKLHGDHIDLYLENEKIGTMKVPSDQATFELASHYKVENQKIYQNYTSVAEPGAKYTDCDQEGGWC